MLLNLFEKELNARERAAATSLKVSEKSSFPVRAAPHTSMSFMTPSQPSCVYCNQPHTSNSCQSIKEVDVQKQLLCKAGRCFNCLRRNHMSQACCSSGRCTKCRGKHHSNICLRQGTDQCPPVNSPHNEGGQRPMSATHQEPPVDASVLLCTLTIKHQYYFRPPKLWLTLQTCHKQEGMSQQC